MSKSDRTDRTDRPDRTNTTDRPDRPDRTGRPRLRGALRDALDRALPADEPTTGSRGKRGPDRHPRRAKRVLASPVETSLAAPVPAPDSSPESATVAHVGRNTLGYVADAPVLQAALDRWANRTGLHYPFALGPVNRPDRPNGPDWQDDYGYTKPPTGLPTESEQE